MSDLCIATHHVEIALQVTTNYRNKNAKAKQEAIDVAETWGIEVKYQDRRIKTTKRHFDELIDDHRINDPEVRFREYF